MRNFFSSDIIFFIISEQLLRQINCLHISKILFKFAASEKRLMSKLT